MFQLRGFDLLLWVRRHCCILWRLEQSEGVSAIFFMAYLLVG